MSFFVKPNTFAADTTIVSADMNENFDELISDYNGSIDSNNIAASGVGTTQIADNAVTSAKIASGTIDDSHMGYDMTDGPMVITFGPNYNTPAGSPTKWRLATFTYSVTSPTAGSQFVNVSFNWSDNPDFGNPSFTDTPIIIGMPVCVDTSPPADDDIPEQIWITAVSSTACTVRHYWRAFAGSATAITMRISALGGVA